MSSTTDIASEAILLDANVLIAASVRDHEHHTRARAWLSGGHRFATCPSTQGSLIRFIVRVASVDHALDALSMLAASARHEFWPDTAPYDATVLRNVTGHRQVTDAYLAALAANRQSRLATFDRGLSLLRPDVVELVD
jgi:toxin-antitoxin system PIN domain toxin